MNKNNDIELEYRWSDFVDDDEKEKIEKVKSYERSNEIMDKIKKILMEKGKFNGYSELFFDLSLLFVPQLLFYFYQKKKVTLFTSKYLDKKIEVYMTFNKYKGKWTHFYCVEYGSDLVYKKSEYTTKKFVYCEWVDFVEEKYDEVIEEEKRQEKLQKKKEARKEAKKMKRKYDIRCEMEE